MRRRTFLGAISAAVAGVFVRPKAVEATPDLYPWHKCEYTIPISRADADKVLSWKNYADYSAIFWDDPPPPREYVEEYRAHLLREMGPSRWAEIAKQLENYVPTSTS